MQTKIQYIIQQYRDIQDGKLWIGTNFNRKLSEVDESLLFTRPLAGLHSIAEIISHLTLWRKETLLKIETGAGSKTDDCEENWLKNDVLQSKGWIKIKSEYDATLTELIRLLELKEDEFLQKKYYDTDFKGNYNYSFVIDGMLHHDLYHLGQIGIIVKFLNKGQNE